MDRQCRKDGVYYVCDYKTGSSPGSQYVADADIQLSMYALLVRRNYPDAKEVRLVWYMLKKEEDDFVITSRRILKQMEDLKEETVLRIIVVESCEDFPMFPRKLCSWCMYQGMCSGEKL